MEPTMFCSHFADTSQDRKKNYVEGVIRKGLEYLRTAVFSIEDHEHLVSFMQKNMRFTSCVFDHEMGFVDLMVQEATYEQGNSRGKLMDDRARMPFQGDESIDTPPLAWTILWRENYSSLYGELIPLHCDAGALSFGMHGDSSPRGPSSCCSEKWKTGKIPGTTRHTCGREKIHDHCDPWMSPKEHERDVSCCLLKMRSRTV
jgi:hypothetical protein